MAGQIMQAGPAMNSEGLSLFYENVLTTRLGSSFPQSRGVTCACQAKMEPLSGRRLHGKDLLSYR